MSGVSKEFVKKAREKCDYSLYSKSDSCAAEWWSAFDRIRDKNSNQILCHIYNGQKSRNRTRFKEFR